MPEETYTLPRILQEKCRAVIYGGGSATRQIENCTAFACRADLEIVSIHQDESLEGGNDLPAGLAEALQQLDSGQADVFLVESLERLPKDPNVRAGLLAQIEATGAILVCSEAHRADGAAYEFHSQISQAIEDYRQALIEQILEQSVLLSEATRARLAARALQTGQDINQLADALLSAALDRDG